MAKSSKPRLDKAHIVELICESLPYTLYGAKWVPTSARMVVYGSRPRATGALQVYEMNSNNSANSRLTKTVDFETESAIRCATFESCDQITRHVALGDFQGNVLVHDLENVNKPVFKAKGHSEIVNCIDGGRAPGPSELVTGSRDGVVNIWDVRAGDSAVASLAPSGEARDCWTVSMGGTNGPSERSVVCGYDNGDVKLWDLKSNSVTWESNLRNGIVAMQFSHRTGPLQYLVAGCLSSQIVTFDLNDKIEGKGYASHAQKSHESSTVWVVEHCPQRRNVVATTGGAGELCLWSRKKKDIKLNKIATSQLSTQPISSLSWHPDKEGLCVMTSFDQTLRIALCTHLGGARTK